MDKTSDHLRVPAFTYDIATWFLHLEACWAGSQDITDLQQFHAVIRAIPTDVAARISAVLSTPPQQDRYKALKTALISALGRSPESYMAELDTLQFDGRRPSVFLSRMQDLNRSAGSPFSDVMLRYRHTSLMPHTVRLHLASVRGAITLQEYAELVDTIYTTYTASPLPAPPHLSCVCSRQEAVNVHAVHNPGHTREGFVAATTGRAAARPPGGHLDPPATTPPTEARLSAVEAALRRIEAAVATQPHSTRHRYCFYHARFGAAARNCQPPCEWSGNGMWGSR